MGKIIDITNQKFGFLTPLEFVHHNGRAAWKCQCDCGNIIIVYSNNLRSGKTKSCGCQRNQIISKKVSKNLIGQKFGYLTVLERTKEKANGAYIWKCQCDCGNITFVPTGNLTSLHTKSCGKCDFCHPQSSLKLSLENKQFGLLTVIKNLPSKNNESMWLCKCKCGNECEVPGWYLTTGKKWNCGCVTCSQGEYKIMNLLNNNNLSYIFQKSFDNCRYPDTNYKAQFDFFVENKYLIEYDGEQHFLDINKEKGFYTIEKIKKIKEHDQFKTEWCKKNNIPLIRIRYTQLQNLELKDIILQEG